MNHPPPASVSPALKWTDPAYVDQLNAKYGVSLEAERLSHRRFLGFARRAAEWNLLELDHIENPAALRNLVAEMRHAVNCLIGDRMYRRRWWHRLFGG